MAFSRLVISMSNTLLINDEKLLYSIIRTKCTPSPLTCPRCRACSPDNQIESCLFSDNQSNNYSTAAPQSNSPSVTQSDLRTVCVCCNEDLFTYSFITDLHAKHRRTLTDRRGRAVCALLKAAPVHHGRRTSLQGRNGEVA